MDTYQTNLTRQQQFAVQHGLKLNPDPAWVEKVVGLMTRNFDAIGEWVCPCKQKSKPPVTGADITCPCPTIDAELASAGHCHCKLFYKA